MQAKMQAAWDIAWCHENCHRQAMSKSEMSGMLLQTCRDIRASLVHWKKATLYLTWQSQRQRPHLLITCWREVKLIVQGLEEQETSCSSLEARPVRILVLAESEIVLNRASDWAKRRTNFDITVLLDSAQGLLRDLLVSCSEKMFEEPLHQALKNQSYVVPYTQEKTSAPSQIDSSTPGISYYQSPFLSLSLVKPKCMDGLTDPDAAPVESWDTSSSSLGFSTYLQKMIPNPHGPATNLSACLMTAVQDGSTALQIQNNLLQSLPEVYED